MACMVIVQHISHSRCSQETTIDECVPHREDERELRWDFANDDQFSGFYTSINVLHSDTL